MKVLVPDAEYCNNCKTTGVSTLRVDLSTELLVDPEGFVLDAAETKVRVRLTCKRCRYSIPAEVSDYNELVEALGLAVDRISKEVERGPTT